MKKLLLLGLWIVVTLVLMTFSSYYYICNMRGLCPDDTITNTVKQVDDDSSFVEVSQKFGFSVLGENDQSIFYFSDSPLSIRSSEFFEFPVSVSGIRDSVFNYLNMDLSQEVVLTGFYEPIVKLDNGDSDSLSAFNRLVNLKDELVHNGVNPSKIELSLISKSNLYSDSDTLVDGLEIRFKKVSDEKIIEIDKGIASKTLYADYGSGHFVPDHTLEGYAMELADYLNRYPEKHATIIGHTDNKGDYNSNYRLGTIRANNLKEYFESKGIASEKLKSSSQGEQSPVSTNDTEEGRALNRRIEVKIK